MIFIASLFGINSQHGIYKYDSGTWTRVQDVPAHTSVFNLHRNPAGHFMATSDSSVGYYVSTDDGDTWSASSGAGGLTGATGWAIGWDEDDVIHENRNTSHQHIEKSTDGGSTWVNEYAFQHTAASPFLTTSQSQWASRSRTLWPERVVTSTSPFAETTYIEDNGVSSPVFSSQLLVRGLFTDDRVVIFGNFFNKAWTYDATDGVVDVSSTLPSSSTGGIYNILPFTRNQWYLAEVDPTGAYCIIYRTEDGGATWSLVLDDITAVPEPGLANGGIIFMARNPLNAHEFLVVGKGGVWHTADNGSTWDFITAPDSGMNFASIAWIGAEVPAPAVTKMDGTTQAWITGTRP